MSLMRLHAAEPDDNAGKGHPFRLQLRTGKLGDSRMSCTLISRAIASGR